MTRIRVYNANLDYEEVYEDTTVRVHNVSLQYDEERGIETLNVRVALDANIEKRGKGWWKKFLRWLGL